MQDSNTDLLGHTASIVQSYVGRQDVNASELPGLIHSVYKTLATVGVQEEPAKEQEPAVPINKSVFPDYIVCLEDGKQLRMLKRHLTTAYGMTPAEYRKKWGLPPTYPMVAPNYAETRSVLAKKMGLGRGRTAPAPAPARSGRNATKSTGSTSRDRRSGASAQA